MKRLITMLAVVTLAGACGGLPQTPSAAQIISGTEPAEELQEDLVIEDDTEVSQHTGFLLFCYGNKYKSD